MSFLVLVNKPPFPSVDGGAIATCQMINILAAQGEKVILFYLNTEKHFSEPENVKNHFSENVQVFSKTVSTKINPLAMMTSTGDTPYIYKRFFDQKAASEIQRLIHKFNPGTIWVEGLGMTVYLDIIRTHNAKKILRAHNVESMIWERMADGGIKGIQKLIYKRMCARIRPYESLILGGFDRILAITETDAAWFSCNGAKTTPLVVPVGIEACELSASTEEGPPRILFLGALDWRPNIAGLQWFLDKIWPEIHAKYPECRLEIAGRNPSPEIRKAVKKPNVDFFGEIEDKREILKPAKIFIVPLFAGSGIRVKILEAWNHGCAVVSTSTGLEGLPAIDQKHLLVANDAKSFVYETSRLIEQPELRRQLSEEGRKLVRENYGMEYVTSLVTKMLASL